MQCCGTKSNINLDSLLQKIREPKPNISTRLNGCQIDYNTKPCKWKSKFKQHNIYITKIFSELS